MSAERDALAEMLRVFGPHAIERLDRVLAASSGDASRVLG